MDESRRKERNYLSQMILFTKSDCRLRSLDVTTIKYKFLLTRSLKELIYNSKMSMSS